MTDDRKPQAEDKYIIRFPNGMRDRLKEAAKANSRTLNAEIVARLGDSFTSAKTNQADAEYSKLYRLQAELDTLTNRDTLITMKLQMLKTEWEQAKEAETPEREKSLAQQINHAHQDWEQLRKRMSRLLVEIREQQLKADEASSEQLAAMNAQIDRMLQNELMEVQKLEEELGVPKEKRTVVKNPSSDH